MSKLRNNFGLLGAVSIYTLYVFRNQIVSIFLGSWQPIIELKQDATLYVGQIQLGLSGQSISDNPFWVDDSSESFVGRNYPLFAFGRLCGSLGLDLSTTFLVGVFCVSSLCVISIYKLNSMLLENRRINIIVTPALCILVFGDFAYRPSPTQWALPFLVISLIFLYKTYSKDTSLLLVFKFALLVLCNLFLNPFYAILILILSSFILLGSIKSSKQKVLALGFAFLCAFFIGLFVKALIVSSPNYELISRWGLLFSHFPGSLRNSTILFLVLLTNMILFRYSRFKVLTIFSLLFSAATLLTMQQNVITGIWWEPESHYVYAVILSIYFTIMNLIKIFREKKLRDNSLLTAIIVLIVSWAFVVGSLSDINTIRNVFNFQQTMESNAKIQEITRVLGDYSSQRDLIAIPSSLGEEATWAGLISNRKFIWNYQGSLLSGSDDEILTRYLCNLNQDFRKQNEIPALEFTQGHRYLNAVQHFGKWKFLRDYLPVLKQKSESNLLLSESTRVSRILPFIKNVRCLNSEIYTANKILLKQFDVISLVPPVNVTENN